MLLSMKWSAHVPPRCWPPGETKSLCTLCYLFDFTAGVFKSALGIRHRTAFWRAESKEIMFSAQNNAHLLLEPQNLEYRIRRNFIFSGVVSWGKKLTIFKWKGEKRGYIA